jgi:CRP-like cAMP-binding protein
MHTSRPEAESGVSDLIREEMPGESGKDTGNRILDELPSSIQRGVRKSLIAVPAGTEVVAQGERITHLFFPTTAICSLLVELASGDKAETAAVGREGFVGVPLVLGQSTSQSSGVIQVAGEGYKIAAKNALDYCKQYEAFRKALFDYAAFRLHLASRSVACNSFHSISQRLARWLLFARDRAGKDEFHLTHEALSAMLAATRPRISQAAARLKAAGIIESRRGKVRILDRQRLEAVACECYEATRRG